MTSAPATVVDAMRERLRNDATFASLVPGGVYDRPLDIDDPVTSAAWVANPTTGMMYLLPSVVLLEPQEVAAMGRRRLERSFAYEQWPDMYIYAEQPDVASTFDRVDARALELLHEWRYGIASVEATGYRAAAIEARELPGTVMTTLRRFRVHAVRHIEEIGS